MIHVQDPLELTMGPVARAIRRRHILDERVLVPNLVGVRSMVTSANPDDPFASQTGRWDDYIGVVWNDGIIWHEHLFCGTTDPGRVTNRPGERGTAVMKPGQYVRAYKPGLHRGSPALVNWGLCAPSYWRVRRVPGETPAVVAHGDEYIGLNIHRARGEGEPVPVEVGPYSAGCQVIKDHDDWEQFFERVLDLYEKARDLHDMKYMTYTLILTTDVAHTPRPQGEQT